MDNIQNVKIIIFSSSSFIIMIIMSTKWSFLLLLAVPLALIGPTQSFKPLFVFNGNSISHREITTRAVLRKTAEVCQSIAAAEGRDFSLTIDDSLTAERVHKACSSSRKSASLMSSVYFYGSIAYIYLSNANVDLVYALSDKHHFDSETFQKGRDLITQGVSAVKASVKLENFIAGRSTLGQLCHTLQDFYSHSNWVELGYTHPYNVLIKPDKPLENLAGPNVPTCRNCAGKNCNNNLLPDVLEKRLLTSGYFNIISSEKPEGKCSHGGCLDQTSKQDPVGGINKDDIRSSHGSLHNQSANLAVIATMQLLEDIRLAVGEKNFLRLMGLSQSSVLCFVFDTTGSMRDDIAQAKTVAFNIIDSKRGTLQEPSTYILVPFNDPGMKCFGPLLTTTDTDIFKERIDHLTSSGGGDDPELSLSGLQLALTAAPPLSEIFVFTDAPAKDAHLKSTITALIESTKSVVTFLLTDVLSSRRKRSLQDVLPRVVSQTDVQLYRDLARASGGQAIEVSKSDLAVATSVIEDSLGSAMVTVFQGVRNPGKPAHFTFNVDGSLTNVNIYITGTSSLTFNLISSTGISQSSSESSGPLASLKLAGNLRRLRLNNVSETGLWKISVDSYDLYSVKVTGQSPVNFIYNLVEAYEGLHADFFLKEGRPLSGGKATLLVTVTGSESVNVTEVTLCDSSSQTKVNGTLQALGGSNFLVTFIEIPTGDFVVRLRGEDRSSSSRSAPSRFQRQASTQMKTSSISLTAEANSTNIEPGSTTSIRFTVSSTASGVGKFNVRATNDRSFDSTSPSSITIKADSRGKANGTVTLTAPDSAASGTDVTITIEVEDAAATDINYVVLRFSVTAKVTDVNGPVCQEASTSTNCSSSSLCYSSQWEFVANVTDGVTGTGIERVTIREGNGTLHTTTVVGPEGENITVASYQASCCADRVELSVVDNVGNVGICVGQVRQSTTVAPVTPANVTIYTTSTGGHTLSTTLCVWITVVTLPLWK
ncbi:von Willebrand factor A domain-containing protein 7-like [Phyllopteryx taeniolatus]|uniref:von Willebrand factor A domain-containing protein 7-like n=1 Tax=Phyllopteryx taeniolatus TaxID=161469 RepID=UPI002AD46F64|nr:von Willebrand factor A domain-containing protein 7-like [Phyllopteryx taeniolatus]